LRKYNITCRQSVVLKALEGKSLSAKRITEICSMDKATLSIILSKLIEHGFVVSASNSNDKRENTYSLSQKGREVISNIMIVENEYKEELLTRVSKDEYENLLKLLTKI
jgi:DNA-binding MarR family transcriptional regulator